jgi:hypothetical protein
VNIAILLALGGLLASPILADPSRRWLLNRLWNER